LYDNRIYLLDRVLQMSELFRLYTALIDSGSMHFCPQCSKGKWKVFHGPGNHIKEGDIHMDQTVQIAAEDVDGALLALLDQVKSLKQDEADPEKARALAIAFTELEKLEAWFQVHCL
jgi:hypothetical protein